VRFQQRSFAGDSMNGTGPEKETGQWFRRACLQVQYQGKPKVLGRGRVGGVVKSPNWAAGRGMSSWTITPVL
jgi:hypothetical protein